MRSTSRMSGLFVLVGVFLTAPFGTAAQSQSVLALLPTDGRSLTVGEEVAGGLSSSDLFGPNGERFEAWSLQGSAGQSLTIDLRSEEFDARLHLVGPGLAEGLQDDDGGAGCDARLELTLLESGTYTVVAASSLSDEMGVYTLAARTEADPVLDYDCGGVNPLVLEELPTEEGRQLAIGSSGSGRLDGTEAEIADGRLGEAWSFEGSAGDRAVVRLSSDDFDPFLYVLGPGLELQSDDDSGGDRNSLLEVQLVESGTYRIVASSYGQGAEGSYRVELLPPVDVSRLPPDGSLRVGESVTGTLPAAAPSIFEGRPGQIWALEGEAGQSITIELTSDAFDPFLYVTGPGLDAPLEDDDSAGNLDSRVELILPETGTYQLVVSSYAQSAEGEFELSVSASF